MRLVDDESTRAVWPHSFQIDYQVLLELLGNIVLFHYCPATFVGCRWAGLEGSVEVRLLFLCVS